MRIPSQFNDSSLYRPRRGESNREKGRRIRQNPIVSRRLFRMGIAMLLVIVVMRQARRPGIYQPFFAAGSTKTVSFESDPGARRTVEADVAVSQNKISQNTEGPTGVGIHATENLRFASDWVQSMDVPLQQAWIGFLARVRQSGDSQSLAPNELDTSLQRFRETVSRDHSLSEDHEIELSEQASAALQFLVRRSRNRDGRPDKAVIWSDVETWASPVLLELHLASMRRLSDATVWVGGDSDAFNLSLLLSDSVHVEQSTRSGVLPLLDQPRVYLGKVISVAGTVQLAEKVRAPENRVGISDYWRVWMIPDDGGKRPFQLICSRLPAAIEAGLSKKGKWDSRNRQKESINSRSPIATGRIVFVGRFLKRLSYRSSIGADLAPVLVGRLDTYETEFTGSTEAPSVEAGSRTWPTTFGIFLAILAGIAIAGVIMLRSKSHERRSRRLRQLTTSEDLEWETFPSSSAAEKVEE
ncbi:MAG: hypothetical protein AAF802_14665 [Planctomycetota bacterium]